MSSFLKIAWIIVLTLSMFFSDFSSQLHTQAWNPTVNTVCSGTITDTINVKPNRERPRERTDISFRLTGCAHIILKFHEVTKNSQRNLVGVIETREGRQSGTVSISKINSSIPLILGNKYEVEVISYASPRYTGQLNKRKSNPFTIPSR